MNLIYTLILIILKKDRSLRLYIDYYLLKNLNINNRYFLSLINKIIISLAGIIDLTKFDLKDIYYLLRTKRINK